MEEDKKLYQDFLDGQDNAFEKIVNKYAEKITYFIFSIVKNIDVAEDLAQDVFVYILANKSYYDFKYSLKTYLYMIGKCRAFNYLKQSKRIILLNDNLSNQSDILLDLEEIVFKNISNSNLKNAIYQLPSKYQSVIYLADIEEIKYKDICKILNINMNQVKTLVHRGRKRLKKILEKDGEMYVG